MFERLNVLIGKWEMEASVEGVPVARAKADFQWCKDHAFLIQHAVTEPPLPTTPQLWIDNNPKSLDVIIGLDEHSQTFYSV